MGSVLLGAMDANQCRVLYIDDRFPTEKWLSRNSIASGHESNVSTRGMVLPVELQTNIDAILQVFSQGKFGLLLCGKAHADCYFQFTSATQGVPSQRNLPSSLRR